MSEFRKYCRKLRKDFPAVAKVIVRVVDTVAAPDGEWWYGSCYYCTNAFVIEVMKHADECVMCDTLFHEWAHVLTYPTGHTRRFFDAYRIIYNKYLGA